jgi:hypothetical protein
MVGESWGPLLLTCMCLSFVLLCWWCVQDFGLSFSVSDKPVRADAYGTIAYWGPAAGKIMDSPQMPQAAAVWRAADVWATAWTMLEAFLNTEDAGLAFNLIGVDQVEVTRVFTAYSEPERWNP